MAVAAVCVVAAGVSGMKAYNAANQSEADMLLSENVEAISAGDTNDPQCPFYGGKCPRRMFGIEYWTEFGLHE